MLCYTAQNSLGDGMATMISVIVPTFNSGKTIKKCLNSILHSTYNDYEVIVVDGGSSDDTIDIIRSFMNKRIKLVKGKDNGAAMGRNRGSRIASGDVLFFIDSDVFIKRNTLSIISEDFKYQHIDAVCGIYDKISGSKSFTSSFDSLKKHFDWMKENIVYCDFFTTARGAVRKKVFKEVGGFNDKLPKTVANEDLEFGHRLIRKGYKILLDKNVKVMHYGPTFFKNLQMFHIRSYNYFKMFSKRRKFENVKTTKKSAINVLVAFIGTILLFAQPLLGIIFLSIFFIMDANFYYFVLKEKGPIFALKSMMMWYILSIAVVTGIIRSLVTLKL